MIARVFLVLASCLVVLGGCRAASAPKLTEPPFTLKELAPNVWAAISNSRSSAPAPANTGFVIGDDGVAVIDASMSVDAEGNLGTDTARQTLAAIRTITKLPVRFVINTLMCPSSLCCRRRINGCFSRRNRIPTSHNAMGGRG